MSLDLKSDKTQNEDFSYILRAYIVHSMIDKSLELKLDKTEIQISAAR